MDSTYPPRRPATSRGRFIFIVAAAAFLLGALVVGYGMYKFGQLSSPTDEAETASVATVDVAPMPSAAPPVLPTVVPEDETPVQTVERVVEQQGGLDQRLAAAEQRIARLDLQAQAAAGNAARAEGLLIAFAVRRTLERGEDLGLLKQQVQLRFTDAQPRAVEAVIALAEDRVTLERLVTRLNRLEQTLEQQEQDEPLTRIQRELGQLFVFRRADSDSPRPERRLERARLRLGNGDVERAIQEVEQLPAADEPVVVQWLEDAARFYRAQQALDVLETTALLEPNRLRDATGDRVSQPSPVGN